MVKKVMGQALKIKMGTKMFNPKLDRWKIMVIGMIVFILSIVFSKDVLWAYDFSDWDGAEGYEEAFNEAKTKEIPFVIYGYATWCKWSKKMTEEYLASYQVREFLSSIPKVAIDCEGTDAERELAKKYNITRFPKFFVFIPALNSSSPEKVYPFLKNRDDYTMEEFIQEIIGIITSQYNKEALLLIQQKDFLAAANYVKKSLSFDPKNAQAYYLEGHINYNRGVMNGDVQLLRDAARSYQEALRLNPKKETTKMELEKLEIELKKYDLKSKNNVQNLPLSQNKKEVKLQRKDKKEGDIIIDGISFEPNGKSLAVINGNIVSEGSDLEGVIIKKINPDSVDVIVNGEERKIYYSI